VSSSGHGGAGARQIRWRTGFAVHQLAKEPGAALLAARAEQVMMVGWRPGAARQPGRPWDGDDWRACRGGAIFEAARCASEGRGGQAIGQGGRGSDEILAGVARVRPYGGGGGARARPGALTSRVRRRSVKDGRRSRGQSRRAKERRKENARTHCDDRADRLPGEIRSPALWFGSETTREGSGADLSRVAALARPLLARRWDTGGEHWDP